MHFFFFVNIGSCQAQRFKLTAYACFALLALKWNALIKPIKLHQQAQSPYTQTVCSWKERTLSSGLLLLPPRSASLLSKPTPSGGASFIWCNTFLLPASGLRLLHLGGCCRFLAVVFGCVLYGGGGGSNNRGGLSGGAGGLGGLRRLWGSVGRMSPTPPFIPSRGWVMSPPASLLSHRGLWAQRPVSSKKDITITTAQHSHLQYSYALSECQ